MATAYLSDKISPILGRDGWVGKIELNYFNTGGAPEVRVLPFYETPMIKETQSARLATYSPIGRATNNFAYLGSNSREFSLKFNITLPHLYSTFESGTGNSKGLTKEQMTDIILGKTSFWNKGETMSTMESGGTGSTGRVSNYDSHYEATLDEMDQKLLNWAKLSSPMLRLNSGASDQRRTIISKIANFVTSVRSSVVNNAREPIYGIPIVRLSYGILYDNVPCVCESYSIDYDPVAGFDLKTLLPRVITVSMSLKETRTFDDPSRFSFIRGSEDGIKGWEVILESPEGAAVTMDPGGGF